MTSFSYKKIFRLAKGFYGKGKNCISVAAPRVDRALQMAYKERKLKKRNMRKSWILSINAAVREHNLPYSRFIYAFNHTNLTMDRKILSDLAINEPFSFKAIIDEVKMQSGLSVEDRLKDIGGFGKAVKAGIVSLPGTERPTEASLIEQMVEKEYIWREGFRPESSKPIRPSPEAVEKLKKNNLWESDWDDEEYWAK